MHYQDHEYYHVYNRGAHKADLFLSENEYSLCLRLLSKYSDQYAVSVVAYCLMPNHYHFVIKQQEGGSISRYIQTVFNAFSQTINAKTKHSGTMFQGKAKAVLIDSDASMLQAVRYIHLNPVRAKLVDMPQNWRFSDYSTWIGKEESIFVESHNKTIKDQIILNKEEYRHFVEDYLKECF
jgi:REP element-mobilizing transposase RayT